MKDHPIAFPVLLSKANRKYAAIDFASANEYLKKVADDELSCWCYDFNFSNNLRLACFSCKNKAENLPEYFKDKCKYSQQAIALVQQKVNVDL